MSPCCRCRGYGHCYNGNHNGGEGLARINSNGNRQESTESKNQSLNDEMLLIELSTT